MTGYACSGFELHLTLNDCMHVKAIADCLFSRRWHSAAQTVSLFQTGMASLHHTGIWIIMDVIAPTFNFRAAAHFGQPVSKSHGTVATGHGGWRRMPPRGVLHRASLFWPRRFRRLPRGLLPAMLRRGDGGVCPHVSRYRGAIQQMSCRTCECGLDTQSSVRQRTGAG